MSFVLSSNYRSERLRAATIRYLELFQSAFQQYGNTESWPFIVEHGITHDMQLLEMLEEARREWLAAEKE